MSTPENTHSVSGERVADDWHADAALAILRELRRVAEKRARGERMFLLTEV